jgi:hypothetical protein
MAGGVDFGVTAGLVHCEEAGGLILCQESSDFIAGRAVESCSRRLVVAHEEVVSDDRLFIFQRGEVEGSVKTWAELTDGVQDHVLPAWGEIRGSEDGSTKRRLFMF